MTYERFEDLPVWKAAMELAERVYAITEKPAFNYKGDLRSQLQRAALSVSNNIAEGFERGTTNELIHFLYIARGSAGEVRSILLLTERIAGFSDIKSEISNLKSIAENVSRQLRGWADHLQNSDIKGQRHLTEAGRVARKRKADQEEFLDMLERMRKEGEAERERKRTE